LEYMADDPATKAIALYIEGSKDGHRLKEALKYASVRKPVVAIKGGLTESGNRVAKSHTGQLTGAPQVWRSLFRQCGTIQVDNFEELTNAMIAFSHSPLPRGNRVGMITNSGGFSVIQTDLCAAEGLDAHRFSDSTLKKIRELVPLAGTSISNPLDAYPIFYNVTKDKPNIETAIKAIAMDENIDSLVIMFDQYRFLRRILGDKVEEHVGKMTSLMVSGSNYCREVIGKPVLISVSIDPFLEDEVDRRGNLKLKKAFEQADFPVFASSNVAIKALAALYKYSLIKEKNTKK
jgi:acyl-CoA synthetase (NDP forming)